LSPEATGVRRVYRGEEEEEEEDLLTNNE